MLKRIVFILVLSLMTSSVFVGCESMGKATGNAVDKAEEGARDFKKGYEEGRD